MLSYGFLLFMFSFFKIHNPPLKQSLWELVKQQFSDPAWSAVAIQFSVIKSVHSDCHLVFFLTGLSDLNTGMGMDGLLGVAGMIMKLVMMDHSRNFPTFSTSKNLSIEPSSVCLCLLVTFWAGYPLFQVIIPTMWGQR